MPFFGAILAYVAFDFYQCTAKKFEKGEERCRESDDLIAGPPQVPKMQDR